MAARNTSKRHLDCRIPAIELRAMISVLALGSISLISRSWGRSGSTIGGQNGRRRLPPPVPPAMQMGPSVMFGTPPTERPRSGSDGEIAR